MTTAPILVPLDGSETAERALPLAAAFATAYSAPLVLLHAVGDAEGVSKESEVAQASDLFATYAREAAGRAGAEVGEGAIQTVHGKAADVILDASKEARMVAIGTHGRGGFHATFIGSVADKVIRGARVPLLVVPGEEGGAKLAAGPVMVALDGSEDSERALPEARNAARLIGRDVVLMRSFSLIPSVSVDITYYPPTYLTDLEDAARAYLHSLAEPGEKVQLMNGLPAEAIVAAAERLDAALIVMASAGKGLAKRLALGSTTDRVVHTVRRPLLIIPPPEE